MNSELEEVINDLPYSIRYSGEVENLIEYAKEQAERVQRLENQQKKNDDYTWKLLMYIKHYRETLDWVMQNSKDKYAVQVCCQALESKSHE